MPEHESGLRTNKKRQTRALILSSAISLFRKSGIRNTRTSEIARASNVSPATLFNYFATKSDLVEAWVRGEISAELARLVESTADRGIRSGLRNCCRTLAEMSCEERVLRLEAWRIAGRAPADDSRVDRESSLEKLITREQDRARLRADLTARALTEVLNEAIEGGLISGLRESDDPAEVAARIRARVDLVLDGARKRNERVSVPARNQPAR